MTVLRLSEAHIIGTVIAFILGVFILPLVISFSQKLGLYDKPDERKIHSHPIPRLGGISIWICTILSFLSLIILSYYPHGRLLSGLLLGGSLMFLLGLVDDIYGLSAKFKFICHPIKKHPNTKRTYKITTLNLLLAQIFHLKFLPLCPFLYFDSILQCD